MKNSKNLPGKPLLAIALMIKNESVSIEATLFSLLQNNISHIFILDTGSTDDTVERVQAFFKKHDLHAYLEQEPFIDFSTSRNRTLALAKQKFPNIPFFLMPDAEWYLYNAVALLDFCAQEVHTTTPLYLIDIKMNHSHFSTARLFRASSNVQFKGVVHEAPEAHTSAKVPHLTYFEVKASPQGVEKSNKRWFRDLELLSAEHKKNPNDPRTAFYLAQTYECLGDFQNAYRMYQHREQLNGWDEENFMTLYRLGYLAQKTNHTDSIISWATAMNYFLKAFALRPHRIEPLVKIAEYYWPSNIQTCYLFINYAYNIPYPKNDVLFINREMYQYTRYEIMSRCAWYMKEYNLGEQATRLALDVHPDTAHLHNNLKLYKQKLALNLEPISNSTLLEPIN
ncbi:tetratricopeptide repeat-containing glycosyltransferase [Legionella sp.]|uniref:tetratricopeptide repeat-containing glycosyltransferase n=1 Tax=Legionella sp. TaxID=459 RepID=UPI003CC130B4